MTVEPNPELTFGRYRLDPEQRLLLTGDQVVPLTPKAWELLAALLRRRGRVVDHERLMNEIWPDAVVEPGNLAKLVFQIRRALGEMPDGRPWVETLSRRGYRLNSATDDIPSDGPGLTVRPAPDAALAIAVLSFDDLSPEGDEQPFCEGIAEEILLALVRVPRLRVIGRTSSFRFRAKDADPREVARLLGASALVAGSVRKSGDRVRVSAQLLDGDDGAALWAEVFERPLIDVFEIQREIAESVAKTLERGVPAPSSPAATHAPTHDMEAWQEYLRGRFLWNRRWAKPMQEALACFQRAVERDPSFAAAWAGIADVYATMGSWEVGLMADEDAEPLAREHAARALALDTELAEAHSTMAYVALHYDRDYAGAEEAFQRSLGRNPSYAAARHWRSHLLVAQRRFDDALAESRIALALDPMNLLLNAHMGWHWHMARDPAATIEASEQVVRLDPSFHWGHFFLGLGAVQAGDPARGVDALREAARLSNESPAMRAALGHAYAAAGDRRAARRVLDALEKQSESGRQFAFERTMILAALDETDAAFDALESAVRHRSGWLAYLDVEPRVDPLRKDPRFARIAGRPSRA